MAKTTYSSFTRMLCAAVLCCLVSCGSSEADSTSRGPAVEQQIQKPQAGKLRLMIAVVNQGPTIADTLEGRCDAALNLIASELPERFESVPFAERNKAIRELEAAGQDPTAARIAEKLGIDRLVFIRVMRLENMLRVGLTMTLAPDYKTSVEGTGYALIRYRNEKTGARIYDTALLEAMQRALAGAVRDSSLFAHVKTIDQVRPAPPIVISGIRFDDKKMKPDWNMFEDKVVTSYEMVLKIFEAIKDAPRYVAYDIDSRDSMYAMRKLYMAENYQAPTPQELGLLESFEVRYIISGSFTRNTPNEAELTLTLGSLDKGTYNEIVKRSTKITADNREQVLGALQNLARELVQ